MTLAERTSVIAVMASMALVVLDAGLINVALPVISTSLHIHPAQAVLGVSSYQAALLVGLLPCAHVAEKLGYSRVFRISLGVFSAASLLCGLATSFEFLVLARVLQGLGGSGILALGIALLRFALGSERLGAAIGWNALNVALCSAMGPVLGAVILSVASWPWLFFAKLPLIMIALAASLGLPKVQRSWSAIDIIGIALHAAIAALLFAAAEIAKGALVWAGIQRAAEESAAEITSSLATHSIPAVLATLNSDAGIELAHRPYLEMLRYGDLVEQPGAELYGYWMMRNAKIFGKAMLVTSPGDRVLVIYGAGHAYWLRHFASEMPGYRLASPLPLLTTAATAIRRQRVSRMRGFRKWRWHCQC